MHYFDLKIESPKWLFLYVSWHEGGGVTKVSNIIWMAFKGTSIDVIDVF